MRVWSIIWRFLWAGTAGTIVYNAVTGVIHSGRPLDAILEFCIACVVINIPLYICEWVNRDEGERQMTLFRWDVAPLRSLIANLLLAPVGTLFSIVALTIQAFMLIFDA